MLSELPLQWMTLTAVYQGSLSNFLFGKNISFFLCAHVHKSHHLKVTQTALCGITFHISRVRKIPIEIICFLCLCFLSSVYMFFLWLLYWRLFCVFWRIFFFLILSFSVWDCDFLLMMVMVTQIRYNLITTR